MNFDEFKNQLIAIQPGNVFLEYIADRINDDNYRGLHISQHNRYDLEYLENILLSIHNTIGINSFKIPPGDYKEDEGYKLLDKFSTYKEIVDNLKKATKKGTYNSLKKTFL